MSETTPSAAKKQRPWLRRLRLRRWLLLSDDLANQKHVRQQRTQMNGRVQVVDELGTDDRLGENQMEEGGRLMRCFSNGARFG